MKVNLTVNGEVQSVDVEPDTPLLWILREHLELTGTKFGCGVAQCGACTVHVDGAPVRSCTTPVGFAEGKTVTTIEGLDNREARALRRAWTELDVPQCGYCQSGQIMQAAALLAANPDPTDDQIVNGMAGNICRCGTYQNIFEAVELAAKGGGAGGR